MLLTLAVKAAAPDLSSSIYLEISKIVSYASFNSSVDAPVKISLFTWAILALTSVLVS